MKMSNLRHPTYSSLLDKFLVTRLLDKKKKKKSSETPNMYMIKK